MSKQRFKCGVCDEWHDAPIPSVVFAEPVYITPPSCDGYSQNVEAAGRFRVLLRTDGEVNRFCRAVLRLLVHDALPLDLHVWVSLSAHSYHQATKADVNGEDGGPFFGWFSTELPGYESTINLKAKLQFHASKEPDLELEPTEHRLSIETREGISEERRAEVTSLLIHSSEARTGSGQATDDSADEEPGAGNEEASGSTGEGND